MPFIANTDAPSFSLHGASFIGLASPSRGATENSVWIVTLSTDAAAVTHRLSREETFVGIGGRALAQVGNETFEITEGSALVVPANTDFKLTNPDATPFRAVAVLPVGGKATIADGQPFTPPWAQ